MCRHKAILLIGPTGSGKTPFGALLEQKGLAGRRCFHFDFGAEMRRLVHDGQARPGLTSTDIEFLRSVLESGALLDDEHFPIAEKILLAFIARMHVATEDIVILNGLPRHVGQARHVTAIVDVCAVVELSCTPEVVFARIHTNAGGDRADRSDDSPDDVRRKLGIFAERTVPLIDYYRQCDVPVLTLQVGATTTADSLLRKMDRRPPSFLE